MNLTRYFCEVCRDDTLHGEFGLCIHCNSKGETNVSAYRDPYGQYSNSSNEAMAIKRKRGYLNSQISRRVN